MKNFQLTHAPFAMKKYFLFAFLLESLIFYIPLTAQPAPENENAALEHARRILKSTPLIDGHNDLPWTIRTNSQAPRDVEKKSFVK